MPAPAYIADTLSKKLIFFTGKGGVGKTTLVHATAHALASHKKRVAVLHWSNADEKREPTTGAWDTVPLETLSAFREYALQILKFEKLYQALFENRVLRTFVLAAPGLSDTVIAGKIWELYRRETYDTLLVDLPSSGHAISFFHSPLGVKRIFSSGFVHKETTGICEMLTQPDVRVDLVALPEELPVQEVIELKSKLQNLHPFRFGFLHINQALPEYPKLMTEPPATWSPTTREMVQNYALRMQRQKENIQTASQVGMPQILLPQFAYMTRQELLESVSETLQKGGQ